MPPPAHDAAAPARIEVASKSGRSGPVRGLLVCVTGIDGAGKTTAARALVDRLNREGHPTVYRYTRYVPVLLRPLMWGARLAFLRRHDPSRDYRGHRDAKRRASARHPFLGRAYRAVLLLDYAVQIAVKIGLPRAAGKNVVCDRYVYDTVVTDLHVDFSHTLDETARLVRRTMRFAPAPNAVFFIDVDPGTAFRRKTDVPDVAYLRERREAYARVAEDLGMVRVDGAQPAEAVAEELWQLTRKVMYRD